MAVVQPEDPRKVHLVCPSCRWRGREIDLLPEQAKSVLVCPDCRTYLKRAKPPGTVKRCLTVAKLKVFRWLKNLKR